ncbi:hypothetical protein [Clostridium sp.]|uniref:hypothetical protein n=1 Tax=Clostridium sp. TaxID=1506 RepID=UPI002FCA28C2
MKLIKETKKYKVYEIQFKHLGNFIIKDPLYCENKFKFKTKGGENYGEAVLFSIVKFENKKNGIKSQCECYQEDTLADIEQDIISIENKKLNNTKFYANWMKLIFVKNKYYEVNINGNTVEGEFIGQDAFKRNTFYFIINGEKVRSEDLKYEGYLL